ncbi:MAG: DUF2974 domain-containing protein [Clostridia bacterium]|jgi:hypothetical protein|nr:DUF2974 domain-containing protein [Clostridia bacterium]
MANMVDYLVWRGELSLEASPWNAIDGLLMATLSYLNFHGIQDARGWTMQEAKRLDLVIESPDASFQPRKDAFIGMADSIRFGESRMHHFIAMTDEASSMQFSAMCIDLPDGTMAVAFRGTDNTLVGWREDFDMAYRTWVPGQEAAAYYLTQAANITDRPLRLAGHSKGGNLAVYAASAVPADIQDRIEGIWSYDGPGMNRQVSTGEGYKRIRDKIHSYIPQTSIIGLLMDYYTPYTVVHSVATGLSQHDPMSWQVYGGKFEEMESIDRKAEIVCETFHEWLQNSTPEQRGTFVDTLFKMADTTNATKMSELLNEKFRSFRKMYGGRKELDPETRRVFNRLMAQAVTLWFGNVVDHVRGQKEEGVDERHWTTMPPEE